MSFTGMAVGLALEGYRPIVEIMFVDFIGVCLEQVYNQAAKNRYMSGGRVAMPIVFKTAGGIFGSAAQHSQCLWGLFAHLPGLRVVVPSCPYDYKGLMAASIASPDPVVFIEHKALLVRRPADFRHGAEVPDQRYEEPLGQASDRPARRRRDHRHARVVGDPRARGRRRRWLARASPPRSSICARSCPSTPNRSPTRWPAPAGCSSSTRTT